VLFRKWPQSKAERLPPTRIGQALRSSFKTVLTSCPVWSWSSSAVSWFRWAKAAATNFSRGALPLCYCHCIMLNFCFALQLTSPVSSLFVNLQYVQASGPNNLQGYGTGLKDLFAIFFYFLICIICHAIIQEYVLDVSIS